MDDRLVTAARVDEDAQYEAGLRPRRLDEYIGQDRIRENLHVAIAAAKQRGEPLDHVLLHGPPGLGKTTLAYVIANEMGVPVRATSGPAIEKPVRATCCSSTRYTVCRPSSRKSSIPPSRTTRSTS
jgi:Holliday junction DNA helicase RuvB